MEKEGDHFLAAIMSFLKFGPLRLRRLAKYFDTWQAAYFANSSDLIKAGIEPGIADEFIIKRKEINIGRIEEALLRNRISITTINDPAYPLLLKQIHTPPFALFSRGGLPENGEICIAIVGTRKSSPYGERAANDIARTLAGNGLSIISGLAYGIDTLAHKACLAVGAKTYAVLGCGLEREGVYPASNRSLSERIASGNGALISEFPPFIPPLRHHFPLRNRIIAGLTTATIVVEAGESSGALITARAALDENRDVYAVPGEIYSRASRGPNLLIRDGAIPINDIGELENFFNLKPESPRPQTQNPEKYTENEKLILNHLEISGLSANEIIRLTKLPASLINSTLTILELRGLIKNIGGDRYQCLR